MGPPILSDIHLSPIVWGGRKVRVPASAGIFDHAPDFRLAYPLAGPGVDFLF
jgi:hypothetical protein